RLRPTLPTPDTSAARLRPGSCPCSGVTMGSKMASATRVVQVVKPHAPLIKFPNRRDKPKLSAWGSRVTVVAAACHQTEGLALQ
ncbi:mCG116118, isoform CRA_c, partial [Mus musculus]